MTTFYKTMTDDIQTKFEALDAVPIVWDNAPNPFEDDESGKGSNPLGTWIRMTINLGTANQVQMGAVKTFRNVGVVTAQIFIPLTIGMAEGYQQADLVADLFRSNTTSGVVYRTPSVQNLGRRDNWWQINVNCPFYKDLLL